jgi:putative endonuclease
MSSAVAKDVLGRFGEDLAVCHLRRRGMEILDRNWRSGAGMVRGELDVVARAGTVLVFCEVKTRRSAAFGLPAEAVSATKQARIRRLARCWLDERDHPWSEIRFDVIAVLCPSEREASIEHLQGVF